MTGHNDKEPRELVEDRQGRKGQQRIVIVFSFLSFLFIDGGDGVQYER